MAVTRLLQLELAGRNHGWTTNHDVILESISWERGLPGDGVSDCVADEGSMNFQLNNSAGNASRIGGLYSPDHANCLAGFKESIGVRLLYVIGGVDYPRFTGILDAIDPVPGKWQERTVRCQCVGTLQTASVTRLSNLPIQVNKRGDEVFQTLIDAAPIFAQPRAVEKDVSLDIFPYTLDRTRDEQTVLRDEFTRLALSGIDKIWERGDGTWVYESRSRRFGKASDQDTFTDHHGFRPSRGRDSIVNRAQFTANPRIPDVVTDKVLYSLNTPAAIAPGQNLSILGPWTDADNPGARVGAVSLVTLVPGVDYMANTLENGDGTDLTSYITIAVGLSGNATSFDISLSGTLPGFMTVLQQRGQPLLDYGATPVEFLDQDSIDASGDRPVTVNMPYQASVTLALEAAQYTVFTRKVARTRVTGFVRRVPFSNEVDLVRSVARDVSDRVGVIDSVTGLSRSFFIDSIRESEKDGYVETMWSFSRVDTTTYWHVEVVGQSELDQTTILGFGYMLGHTDVRHGDVAHGDVTHGDTAHVDSHTDHGHSDGGHGDSPHEAVAHSDTPHSDTPHDDAHADDPHGDVTHQDSHSDTERQDTHSDVGGSNIHFDGPGPPHSDQHFDYPHGDSHADALHADEHHDVAFVDEAPENAHGDSLHVDTTHGDTSHGDTDHSDEGHGDSGHGDVAHGDVAHSDVTHIDSHTDILHGDVN